MEEKHKMEQENPNAKPVKLENTREIELPKLDLEPFVGQKAVIEKVEEFEGAKYGYYVKLSTGVLDTIENSKGETTEIRATLVLGLQKDENNKVGWGKDTNMGRFLAKHKLKHYNDAKGIQVLIITQTSKKDGKDYLTFN